MKRRGGSFGSGALAVFGAAALGSLACCGPTVANYEVRVSLDPDVSTPAAIEVDMIALGGDNADDLLDKTMFEYFSGADEDRRDYDSKGELFRAEFLPGQTEPIVLERTDPIWREWASDSKDTLFVMASVPGAENARDRRLEVPRWTDRWERGSRQVIEILVRLDEIRFVTTPRDPE